MPCPIRAQQVRELAAAVATDERTIRRAYVAPLRIRETTRVRVTRAAQRLGIDPPPQALVLALRGKE